MRRRGASPFQILDDPDFVSSLYILIIYPEEDWINDCKTRKTPDVVDQFAFKEAIIKVRTRVLFNELLL